MKAKLFFVLFVITLILTPHSVLAQDECGLDNLGSCIVESLYDSFIDYVNAPIMPLLNFLEKLLTADVYIAVFKPVWNGITYVLSILFLFLLIYFGFVFMTCSGDPIKRAHAKEGLKNTIFMIVFIYASFFIYDTVLNLVSILNTAMFSMVDPNFFKFTFDNLANTGLELLLSPMYLFSLLITILLLILRYIVVSVGVILFPIGLFCYFVPPLKSHGKFIIHLLAFFIFVTFIDLLIILACSLIVKDSLFANFEILVMIACFFLINYGIFWCVKFAISKSSFSDVGDDIKQATKYIALAVA